jgi:hypothetical protein
MFGRLVPLNLCVFIHSGMLIPAHSCCLKAAGLPARMPFQEGTKQPWKPQGSA